jgi:enoyl-CoA hydratase
MPGQHRFIEYTTTGDGIAIITLNRPRQRNAQNRGLLVELGAAFETAEADDAIKVVILRGAGSCFSAGHDIGSDDAVRERQPGPEQHETWTGYGGTKHPVERQWRQEWHFFLTNTRRWRDLRKITIASVNGPVYSAGLMLMWACDLIVAAEDTVFADVVGTRLGMCGVEYFAHPWELGARKAKELLLTGDALSVQEAHQLGMVSKIFTREGLEQDTLAFAQRVCQLPSATALMIKEAVNQTQDNQGFFNSIQAAFTLHELNHSHWLAMSGGAASYQTPEMGGIPWREAPPIKTSDARSP